MNQLIRLLLLVLFSTSYASGQVLISEIMYNPPESDTDSLEYIELYNPEDTTVSLSGYSFSNGVSFSFPDTSIASNGYFLVVRKADAMRNTLGIEAIEWESGALSNGGEIIELLDADSTVVDAVEFNDASPWPRDDEGTDGEGASIEFCVEQDDNAIGESWRASTGSTGVIVNGRELLGTPGAANSAICTVSTADHTIIVTSNVFTPADLTINIGETVLWKNEGGNHNVNGSIETFPNNPDSFGNGAASTSAWEYEYTFTSEGVYDYQCDPHVSLGMTGRITVIDEDAFNVMSIALASEVDTNGVAIMLDQRVEISGITYGVNFNPAGLLFTMIDDANAGISLYLGGGNLGYSFMEGDRITVKGTIGQYNGLTQIEPDSIFFESAGNDLVQATEVLDLGEETESRLVKIVAGTLIDSSQWLADGSSFNVDVQIDDVIVVMRIDSATELANMELPGVTLDITGIGGQYDTDTPFLEGYQIFPRYSSDLQVTSGVGNQFLPRGLVHIYPNPASSNLVVEESLDIEKVLIYDVLGRNIFEVNFAVSTIDISNYKTGKYYIHFVTEEGIVQKGFVKI